MRTWLAPYFNPRARVGRDENTLLRVRCPRHFNPRARVGRDTATFAELYAKWTFQSTRPRGARRHFLYHLLDV